MWLNESNFDTLRESTIGWFIRVNPNATKRDHYTSQLHEFLATHSTFADAADVFTPVTPNNKRSKSS
jgi:hypothetical protein